MPIEIRELYIKAVVDAGGGKTNNGQPGTDAGKPANDISAQNAEQLIDLCVEKVLEILKEKRER